MAIIGVLNTIVQAQTDQFDGKLAGVDKRITQTRVNVNQNSAQMRDAFNNLASMPWVSTIVSGIGRVAAAMFSIVGVTALAITGVVGLGVAFHTMASRGAADIKHLYDTANNLEFDMTDLTAFSMAPGVDGIEGIANSVFRLQGQLENLGGRGREALQAMGVELDALKNADAAEQIRMLADGYTRLEGQAERAGALRGLFGRGGAGMMDVLEQGRAGLDALRDRAMRFGLDVSESQAKALRMADVEWKGLGLAIQGVGRQAAIMFAPVWEAIGRVGSAIGERLVGLFRAAQPYLEQFGAAASAALGPIWEGLSNVGSFLADAFQAVFPLLSQIGQMAMAMVRAFLELNGVSFIFAAWKDMGGSVVGVFTQIVTWGKIWFEVMTSVWKAVGDVAGILWGLLWEGIKTVAQALAEAFNLGFLRDWFNGMRDGWNAVKTMALTVFAAIKVALDQMKVLWGMTIDAVKLKWLELRQYLGEGGLEPEIDRLTEALRTGAANFQGAVRAQVRQWEFELAGGLLQAGAAAAAAANQALNRTQVGLLKAVTDHGAVTRESEKAFTMLFGTRGNQDFYAKLQADRALNQIEILRDIRGEIRNAPVMRRARV